MKKGVRLLLVCLMFIVVASGCGVSHKSPEGVVKSLIKAYDKEKEKTILECYGIDEKADKTTQAEIDWTIKYFKAHDAKSIEVIKCDTIKEYKKYALVYVYYELNLGNKKAYPCISTYMTRKKDGKYYIMPSDDITEKMSRQAATDYAAFMNTDVYKDYTKAYEVFIKKNPGYEDKISSKLL